MNILNAVIAGLTASLVFSIVLAMAPKMGMPKMDIVSLLGSMFSPKPNQALGWMMHLMMGVIFALIYAFLWSSGISAATWVGGLIFGTGQWLVVGMVMGMIPMMHVGSKAALSRLPACG
jgi:riboflavin transporter FmnP